MPQKLFIFDTNVYLDLYSYSKEAIEEVVAALKSDFIFSKIYIPKQVYDEFTKNYLRVRNEHKKFNTFQKNEFKKKIEKLNPLIANLFSEKYDRYKSNIRQLCDDIEKNYLNNCEKIINEFDKLITEVSTSYDSDENDTILKFINDLYEKCKPIGFTRLEKLALSIEAEQRAKLKLAPGYKDMGKESLDSYGDFFVWKEILSKREINQRLILVQNETKLDWWQQKEGKLVASDILLEECPELKMMNFQDFSNEYLILKDETYGEISQMSTLLSYIMSTDNKNIFLNVDIYNLLEDALSDYIKDSYGGSIKFQSLNYDILKFEITDREFFDVTFLRCDINLIVKYETQIIVYTDEKVYYPSLDGIALCEVTFDYSIDKYDMRNPLKFVGCDYMHYSQAPKSFY